MNKRDLPEIRCPYCNKLIAKGEAVELEFRCGRCKNFFILRATRPNSERPERPQELCHAESGQPVQRSRSV
ncbi:Com family DNA-binding transcriptional regulator [Desulfovibrio piger]|uniref:Com family DNA-binding transcriptional regulator n=1 Tax=Desulfovibrio piger TaxID=901 RepID=UPI0026667759|nr:Com family DNA-binding transcriptional regulator [Desulfovibrio piger]